jgi:hypothetical protein
MTRIEFEQHYLEQVQALDVRRYHKLMPLNIRLFEAEGWKYTWMDQTPDGWVFWGKDGAKTFRVHVPKTGTDLKWEWDWEWQGESIAMRSQKENGGQ